MTLLTLVAFSKRFLLRVQWQVMALNGVGKSEPFELQLIAPGERQAVLEPGMRVRAVWAGCLAILSISRHCFKFDPGLVEWNNME